MTNEDRQLTDLINAWSQDQMDGSALFERIMADLRASARRNLYGETGVRWQTTELVNEALLKLSAQRNPRWQNRQHFFALLEILMKRCIQEELRHNRRQMRDSRRDVVIDDAVALPAVAAIEDDVIELGRALAELRRRDPLRADVFERKAVEGQTFDEIATAVGRSDRVIRRHWEVARAWLAVRLGDGSDAARPHGAGHAGAETP